MTNSPDGRRRPPTLDDVARLAGVSTPTASRALNGGIRGTGSVTEERRLRVLEAAAELGYSVSVAAQATKGGRSRTVALLVSNIDDFGAATMIAGVMHAAEDQGVSVAVRATLDDPEREQRLLRELRGDRHHGVIVATSRSTDAARERAVAAELRVLQEHGARVVVIGANELPFARVVVDNSSPAAELAGALVDDGHRRFAVLAGPVDEVTSRDRLAGFTAGLLAHGVERERLEIVHEEFSRAGGWAAADRLLPRIDRFDHLAAMSDAMAVGAIARLHEAGLRVPDDVSMSGYDNVPIIADLLPGFRTVALPLESYGRAAMALIFDEGTSDSSVIPLTASAVLPRARS